MANDDPLDVKLLPQMQSLGKCVGEGLTDSMTAGSCEKERVVEGIVF